MSEDDIDTQPDLDYRTLPPLCGPEQFEELIQGIITDEAPRLFAIVQEFGTRLDGRVAAWGMAFSDGAHVITAEGGTTMITRSPESAARRYHRPATATRPAITARVVWR